MGSNFFTVMSGMTTLAILHLTALADFSVGNLTMPGTPFQDWRHSILCWLNQESAPLLQSREILTWRVYQVRVPVSKGVSPDKSAMTTLSWFSFPKQNGLAWISKTIQVAEGDNFPISNRQT